MAPPTDLTRMAFAKYGSNEELPIPNVGNSPQMTDVFMLQDREVVETGMAMKLFMFNCIRLVPEVAAFFALRQAGLIRLHVNHRESLAIAMSKVGAWNRTPLTNIWLDSALPQEIFARAVGAIHRFITSDASPASYHQRYQTFEDRLVLNIRLMQHITKNVGEKRGICDMKVSDGLPTIREFLPSFATDMDWDVAAYVARNGGNPGPSGASQPQLTANNSAGGPSSASASNNASNSSQPLTPNRQPSNPNRQPPTPASQSRTPNLQRPPSVAGATQSHLGTATEVMVQFYYSHGAPPVAVARRHVLAWGLAGLLEKLTRKLSTEQRIEYLYHLDDDLQATEDDDSEQHLDTHARLAAAVNGSIVGPVRIGVAVLQPEPETPSSRSTASSTLHVVSRTSMVTRELFQQLVDSFPDAMYSEREVNQDINLPEMEAGVAVDDVQQRAREDTFAFMKRVEGQMSTEWGSMQHARTTIDAAFPADHFLHRSNGIQRWPDDQGREVVENHKIHQYLFLAWAISQRATIRGGLCADEMGLGKSHEIISLLIAMTELDLQVGIDSLPNLLVVPSTIKANWKQRLTNELPDMGDGQDWEIFVFGKDKQPGYGGKTAAVSFDRDEQWFAKEGSKRRRLVLLTYEQLQQMTPDNIHGGVGLFHRIILDEGHMIRRGVQTKSGSILFALDAEERWSFTGTPMLNHMRDLYGQLQFLFRPEWTDEEDKNELLCAKDTLPRSPLQVNGAYLRFQELGDTAQPVTAAEARVLEISVDSWTNSCACDKRQLCQHWPALMHKNMGRRGSMDDETRILPPLPKDKQDRRAQLRRDKKVDARAKEEPVEPISQHRERSAPYANNPYNLYHANNMHRLEILDPEAFYWWVVSHGLEGTKPNIDLINLRTIMILNEIMLKRNTMSTFEDDEGNELRMFPLDEIPPMTIIRRDLTWCTSQEAEVYEARSRVARASNEKVKLSEEELAELDAQITQEEVAARRLELEDDASYRPGGGSAKATGIFHKIFQLCTSQLLPGLRSVKLVEMAKKPVSLKYFLNLASTGDRGGQPGRQNRPEPTTDIEILQAVLWGSPVMKAALADIFAVTYRDVGKNNVLVFTHTPRSAALLSRVLGFLGVDNILLHATMKAADRGKLFDAWDSSRRRGRVLIATYALNLAGLNGHHNCDFVILLEPAFNAATEAQAYHRVRRLGQTTEQTVVRYMLLDSYMEVHLTRMRIKAIGIAAAVGAYHHALRLGAAKGEDMVTALFGGNLPKEVEQFVMQQERRGNEIEASRRAKAAKGKGRAA